MKTLQSFLLKFFFIVRTRFAFYSLIPFFFLVHRALFALVVDEKEKNFFA